MLLPRVTSALFKIETHRASNRHSAPGAVLMVGNGWSGEGRRWPRASAPHKMTRMAIR